VASGPLTAIIATSTLGKEPTICRNRRADHEQKEKKKKDRQEVPAGKHRRQYT
jgi:hypothetical protein